MDHKIHKGHARQVNTVYGWNSTITNYSYSCNEQLGKTKESNVQYFKTKIFSIHS